jgi:hypothetical protein
MTRNKCSNTCEKDDEMVKISTYLKILQIFFVNIRTNKKIKTRKDDKFYLNF